MPDMLAYRAEKLAAGWAEKKVLNKFAAYKVLILDEHLIDKPTTEQMHFLLELTERRYDSSSTIFCSQYPVDERHRRMGGGAHAESVMDRIVHNAVWIQMGDVNMRQRTMGKRE
jgi:DNA replication protein DnaC